MRRDRRETTICPCCDRSMSIRTCKDHLRRQPTEAGAGAGAEAGASDREGMRGSYADAYDPCIVDGGDSSGPSGDESCGDEPSTPITPGGILMGFATALRAWQQSCGVSVRALLMLLKVIGLVYPPAKGLTYWYYQDICELPKHSGAPDFVKYTQCNSCYDLTNIDDDLGDSKSPTCQKTRIFRNRTVCATKLYERVKKDGGFVLQPRLVSTIRSITIALGDIVGRPGIWAWLDAWREGRADGSHHHGIRGRAFSDVMDGDVWTSFMQLDGRPYLSTAGNLCLSLNLDWFQPFSDTPYSCGVMYLAIMNLPPHLRYKRENCIILAAFPPSTKTDKNETQAWNHLNSMLAVVVDELEALCTGIEVQVKGSGGVRSLRAIVIMLACDQPAQRKLCGFMGSGSMHSCWRCPKAFVLRDRSVHDDLNGDDESEPDGDGEGDDEKRRVHRD